MQVSKLVLAHKQARIAVSGVSLGGAVASMVGYSLSLIYNSKVDVYTYGEPRLGNKKLIDEMNKRISVNRIVYYLDPFPHLPPRNTSFNPNFKDIVYYHPGTEFYYGKSRIF